MSLGRAVLMLRDSGISYRTIDTMFQLPRGDAWRLVQRVRQKAYNAIARCYDEHRDNYHRYGGRGIGVHPPWVLHPSAFVAYLTTLPGWDDESLWLDRIDNDGDYAPGNLRFVTPEESNLNRGRNHVGGHGPRVRG